LRITDRAFWALVTERPVALPPVWLEKGSMSNADEYRQFAADYKAAKASEMAGQELDLLGDPSATDEERQLRKQRLIKGPEEFRDIRSNRARASHPS
jgi:hypothetical protein